MLLRELLGYLPLNNAEDPPHRPTDDDPNREEAALDSIIPASSDQPYDMAAVVAMGSASASDPLPADPKARALHLERRELERRIEALKLLKGSMPADRYASDLEKLATDLALKTRQIRELEKK